MSRQFAKIHCAQTPITQLGKGRMKPSNKAGKIFAGKKWARFGKPGAGTRKSLPFLNRVRNRQHHLACKRQTPGDHFVEGSRLNPLDFSRHPCDPPLRSGYERSAESAPR